MSHFDATTVHARPATALHRAMRLVGGQVTLSQLSWLSWIAGSSVHAGCCYTAGDRGSSMLPAKELRPFMLSRNGSATRRRGGWWAHPARSTLTLGASLCLSTAIAASCSKALEDGGSGGADASGATEAGSTSASSTAAATGGGGAGGAGCDCASDSSKPFCDEATGECVECTPADDVCVAGQYCNEATLSCEVGCTDDSDCTQETQCDVDAHICVGCLVDSHCPPGAICTSSGQCVPGCTGSQPCQVGKSCCTSTCIDLSNNVDNCGLCNASCIPAPHTIPSCVDSLCDFACQPDFADCNGDGADGCEQNVLQDGPCTCSPGSTQSCYLGVPGTQGVGPCKAGLQTCDAGGLSWGGCVGAVFPAGEACNLIDDDCNGAVDDGCVPPDGCAAEVITADTFPVDIVWVVDNSGSMSQEIAQVESNINNQFTSIIAASGLDYRVAVISDKGTGSLEICVNPPLAGPVCSNNPPLFRIVDQNVQSTDSLSLTLSTYDSANAALNWSTFVRMDAVKVFIEVTDDNSAMSAATFDTQLLAKNPAGMFGTAQARNYVFHSIIGIENNNPGVKCPTAVNTGSVYQDLSNLTGGMMFSVCSTDYSPIFNAIAGSVVLFGCEYKIPQPAMGTIDYGKVNVEYTPGGGNPAVVFNVADLASCDPVLGGWYYDSAANPTKIILCPASCDQVLADINGTVKILVGCATIHQ
jgi:hypothetical protein